MIFHSHSLLSIRRSLCVLAAVLSASIGHSAQDQVCQVTIRAGSWFSSGVRVTAGQKVVVKATGKMRYAEGQRIEFGPGGDMYGVWSVKAKIGTQIVDLRSEWTFRAEQTGTVELGVPARANIPVEKDANHLDPNYSLCANVSIAEEAGAIAAVLTGPPTEVWVGWGRPSMAAGIMITGFRRNTADPVVLDCPNSTNGFGDHPVASDRLKTVRIFPCGANQQTYDWPATGYNWGIMISAPARDLENDQQPGRPRDICIGTNPVRLRVSQKGAGEAFVTISPQLLLKAGLVGGGGTYGPTTCTGDARGGGGGGGGGGGAGGPFRCGLGTSWDENESGWTGAWRRRGDSNVFDARWTRSGYNPMDQVLTITLSGNSVSIFRQDPNVPGNTCTYTGTVGSDGVTVTGEYTCNDRGNKIGPVPWSARINCTGGTQNPALTGKFGIRTVNGNYLSAVGGGGIRGPGAINTDATQVSGWETFTLVPQSDGTFAIQTSRGTYLTAMRGGGLTGTDTIHTDATRIDAWEKFTLEYLGNLQYAIKTVNGNYLTALGGGGAGNGKASIHSNATAVGGWEKFYLVKL
jgi:hypothetical protein